MDVIFLLIVVALNAPGVVYLARMPRCPGCGSRWWVRRWTRAYSPAGETFTCLGCNFVRGDADYIWSRGGPMP